MFADVGTSCEREHRQQRIEVTVISRGVLSLRRNWPIAPAVFNLNGPAHYVHWHFFQMSVANITVIVLMIVVFVAAILLPFPRGSRQP
jgi:hypothetical protein